MFQMGQFVSMMVQGAYIWVFSAYPKELAVLLFFYMQVGTRMWTGCMPFLCSPGPCFGTSLHGQSCLSLRALSHSIDFNPADTGMCCSQTLLALFGNFFVRKYLSRWDLLPVFLLTAL